MTELSDEARHARKARSNAPRLLVVDDDREIRDLLSALLSRKGYKVVTAREEQEMRRVLKSSRVDLIILDLMLPGKDGLAICRELRATKAVPIIMLTARGEPTDQIVGLEMGADDYLPKPFEVRELEARIKAVLRRSGVFILESRDQPWCAIPFRWLDAGRPATSAFVA